MPAHVEEGVSQPGAAINLNITHLLWYPLRRFGSCARVLLTVKVAVRVGSVAILGLLSLLSVTSMGKVWRLPDRRCGSSRGHVAPVA